MESTIRITHIDGNATPAVVEACGKARQSTLISFEKGVYHFKKEGSSLKEISCGNIKPGEKNIVFDLEDASDLTIDGNGSEFIFDEILFPFSLQHCRNVTLRNFTIDFSFTRYCQGEVVQSDENCFELAIDADHFITEVDAAGHVVFHSRGLSVSTEERGILMGNSIFGKGPWDYVFAGDSRGTKENLPAPYIVTDAVATERGIRFVYRKESRRLLFDLGDNLIFCYEPRTNVNIFSNMCENIRLENVSMYRGGGMGVVVVMTRDFFADNLSIQVKPGRNECRSTTADGIFIVQCSGTVSIRNSLIANTLDDALNIHGIYHKVSEAKGNCLLLEVGHPAHLGFMNYEPGDTIEVSDHGTQRHKASFTIVKAVTQPDGRIMLELDGDCTDMAAEDLVENQSRVANFVFEDNRVVCCPHLRISDNGSHSIRRNTFDRISHIIVQDLLRYWYEAGAVDGMVIEDNLFTGCPRFGDAFPISIGSRRKPETDIRHKNIAIINNRFILTNSRAISADRVDGLVIRGNQFQGTDTGDLFRIGHCSAFLCDGNAFVKTE